jgi:hypothetical protein
VIEELHRRGAALFVSDLRRRFSASANVADQLDAALSRLESAGSVLVRDHYCGDPHLEGEDLRVAGLVEQVDGEDPLDRCVRAIEAVWTDWLAEYLANHRCS